MMSIQEQWYRKAHNGGLGYQYPARGYGFYGGMITDKPKSIQEQDLDKIDLEEMRKYNDKIRDYANKMEDYAIENQIWLEEHKAKLSKAKLSKANLSIQEQTLLSDQANIHNEPETEQIEEKLEEAKEEIEDAKETLDETVDEIIEDDPEYTLANLYKVKIEGKTEQQLIEEYDKTLYNNNTELINNLIEDKLPNRIYDKNILAIIDKVRYALDMAKIKHIMPDFYSFIERNKQSYQGKLYKIDDPDLNPVEYYKNVYKPSLDPIYKKQMDSRYYNPIYERASDMAIEKRTGNITTERGNIMETLLDPIQDFFQLVSNTDVQDVKNTKDINSNHYTELYKDIINQQHQKRSKLESRIKELDEELEDPNISDNEYIKKSDEQTKLANQLSKEPLPHNTYYVVDYVGDKGLYELKTLELTYPQYKNDIRSPERYKLLMPYIDNNGNSLSRDIKDDVKGGINLVATKIEGYDKMKIKFGEDNNGNKYISNITYNGENTLNEPKYNYDVIFALKDGFFKYNVLKDPNLYIKRDGTAILLNTPKGHFKGDKTKIDYYIPVDRLEPISKDKVHDYFNIKRPIKLKMIPRHVNELIEQYNK